ncbi:MAG: helix-turn-helix domain-containing protein [Lactobacillales bacterium]|jgi:transcriptional regulator with XRE-family HTH domain|nr:helix-turn-helix domain-containing protein [Lactobacillales bacterium]
MNNLGAMVRAARIKQGYKQAELENILPQSRISVFETGKCDIMAQDLMKILEKIKVSPADFFNTEKEDDLAKIISRINKATTSNDVETLEIIKRDLIKFSPNTKKKLGTMIYILSCRIKKEKFKKSQISWFIKYFDELVWYEELDLIMLNDCLVIFEKNDLKKHFDYVLAVLTLECNQATYRSCKMLLLHIILKLLADNELEDARELRKKIETLDKWQSQSLIITERIIDSILLYRDNQDSKAMNYMQDTLKAVEIFGSSYGYETAEAFTRFVNFQEAINKMQTKKDYTAYYDWIAVISM